MTENRCLAWDGCVNVRDLGGLKTCDGHVTRWGAVVRSDHPARLTAAGWSALYAHGIRTIISLRTHGMTEDVPDTAPRPSDLTTVCAAIEDVTEPDDSFVQKWCTNELWCTPLYYRDALDRWPERHAAALSVIARAQPGGVLIHCKRGVDRTGIMTLLLLTLVGVAPDDIVADYELSLDPEREALLAREHTSTRDVLYATLDWLDIEAYLREGGLSQDDLAALRARFLEPVGTEGR
ncbi:MAG: tyrosine-protein phosphatase [Anaerolineae bacterium]|nr:tyrosine-protein phosphatase [Anaerolineae bacterium]